MLHKKNQKGLRGDNISDVPPNDSRLLPGNPDSLVDVHEEAFTGVGAFTCPKVRKAEYKVLNKTYITCPLSARSWNSDDVLCIKPTFF